jgi:N-acyl homoserine lactone hydrolase
LITHFHWDHVNGAPDVPNAQVLVREPDLAWADHGHTMIYDAVPHHAVDRIRSRIKEFKTDGPAYEGFAGSYDLLGDGSVIGVPTPGHTPGSVSWFVNSGDGRRWLFVGDAAWIGEGISRPVMKGWKGRLLDNDNEKTGETLSRLHALQAARPLTVPPDGHGVQVVTAHDPAGLATLPVCSK